MSQNKLSESRKKHTLIVDRIEGSSIIIEVSDRENPDIPNQMIELPLVLFNAPITEGMEIMIQRDQTTNEQGELNFHLQFRSVLSEKNDTLQEARDRLERLKESSPTDEIIDL
jgi:hypothetical protein